MGQKIAHGGKVNGIMGPKVTIIIPFYNCPYVAQAIESALKQTYRNVEIIVVNDGSTIHADKIRPFIGKLIYIEKSNGGTASALNEGLKRASGDYIAWLSSDDKFQPRKLEKQLAYMQALQSSICYTNFSVIDEKSRVVTQKAGTHYPDRADFVRHLSKGCHINGCTIMFKKEVYDKVGEFNSSYKYTQDYDYWLRVVQHYPFDYLDEPLTLYRVHSNMGSKQYPRAQRAEILELRAKYKRILAQLEWGTDR